MCWCSGEQAHKLFLATKIIARQNATRDRQKLDLKSLVYALVFCEKPANINFFLWPPRAPRHDPGLSKSHFPKKFMCSFSVKKTGHHWKIFGGQKWTPEITPEALDGTILHSSTRRIRKSPPERPGSLPDPSFGGQKFGPAGQKIHQKSLSLRVFSLSDKS